MLGPPTLILDTGPLWELILYSAVHNLRFRKLESELLYLKTKDSFNKLSEFIAFSKGRVTTPHVVSEISFRIVRTEEKSKASLWNLVYDEFRSMGMDEELFKLLLMPPESVARIGAVDVSIFQLGANYSFSEAIVLSLDNALIAECNDAGIIAKHISEVIT